MKIFGEYHQTAENIENRLKEMIGLQSGDKINLVEQVQILGVLDLTTLEGSDTEERIINLCRQAVFSSVNPGLPDAAAVCVYPSLVRLARKELNGTNIKVASVAGAFPSGQSSLNVKLEEVRFAIGEGADEIDTVISRGKLLEGRESEVFDELSAIRETCGKVTLKVILETGELREIAMVRKASEISILAGADFIKTSTGKITAGAEPGSFLVMLDTILEYLQKTGKAIGIKPAGGIRTVAQAWMFISLLIEILGSEYFDKDLFRIGASSLAVDILSQANKLQGPDYF